jgi:hypothetical protein
MNAAVDQATEQRKAEHQRLLAEHESKVGYYPAFVSGPGLTVIWHDEEAMNAEGQSQNGALIEDVINVAMHRLSAQQSTPLRCAQNEDAIDYLRAATAVLSSREHRS